MIRPPNTPVERPNPTSQEAVEDQRQLAMWRNELYRILSLGGSVTGTPGLIAGGAIGTLTVTVTGCFADKEQSVMIGAPSTIDAGLMWSAYISAKDTVKIRIYNTTGGNITPASLTWAIRVLP